jgi:hypothetical protein
VNYQTCSFSSSRLLCFCLLLLLPSFFYHKNIKSILNPPLVGLATFPPLRKIKVSIVNYQTCSFSSSRLLCSPSCFRAMIILLYMKKTTALWFC